jgi:broad specificity phosphatase PhoE
MQDYHRPEILTLKGEEAAAVLREYLKELQRGKPEELTERQTDAMIKITEGLLSSIETEAPVSAAKRRHHLLSRVTRAVQQLDCEASPQDTSSVLHESAYLNAHHRQLPLSYRMK